MSSSRALTPYEFAPQVEHVVHGPGAPPQVQHGPQGAGYVGLGPLHRRVQLQPLGQLRRRWRWRACSPCRCVFEVAMRLPRNQRPSPPRQSRVVRVVHLVPRPLQSTAQPYFSLMALAARSMPAASVISSPESSSASRDVGGQYGGQRQQPLLERAHGVLAYQPVAGRWPPSPGPPLCSARRTRSACPLLPR